MKKLLLLVIPALLFWGNTTTAQTALDFNGTSSYVDAGNSFSLTSYTKEVWVKWDGTSTFANNTISGSIDNQHAFWAPGHESNRVTAGHNGKWDIVEDPNPMTPDVWVHYAVTYDGETGEMVLYRDCQEVDRGGINPEQDYSGFVLTEVNLGAFIFGEERNLYGGKMDDVRIWNHVRTLEQICGNYEECLDGTEEGLAAFYDFEDGAGSSTLADLTGKGHDGTLIDFDIDNDWVEDGVNGCGEEEPEPECIEITSFYPNPTWNRVYMNLNGSYNSLQVRVYNRWGYYIRGKYVSGPTDKVYASLYGLHGGRYYYAMVIDCETWKYDYVRVYKRSWC